MRLAGTAILLIEDAPDIRDAFTVLLRTEGAEVTPAGSGREAAECLARQRYDIVLTDLGLPDIPGDVLIRQIVTTASSRPRVVAVTGYGEPERGRARAAGADAVLAKPVEWSELLEELRPPPRTSESARPHRVAA
jgi:CheY-like chemotaxis protein